MECIPYNKETLKQAVQILKDGGVIAHPADTCYGLAGDFLNPDALKKIKIIKGRNGDKPMSIMFPVAMRDDLVKYVQMNDFAYSVCSKLLPGPVTILLPKGPEVPDYYFPQSDYLGLRIPYDILTQDLLSAFRGPLITTSANITDQPPCSTSKEVKESFENTENKPDLVFEGAVRNICMPSTVIMIENGKVKITREGPIDKRQLEGILGVEVN